MEKMRPLKMRGGGIRRIADLQAASVYRGIYPLIRKMSRGKKGVVLDAGCGAQPYRKLFPDSWDYYGIDIENAGSYFDYHENNVIYYKGEDFPVPDSFADLVFHSEVIEHVSDTAYFLKECNRVLKNGGHLLMSVPFQARYHYIPYDYWRFTPSGLKKILMEAGFTDILIMPRSRDICVAAYKVLTIGYRLFFSRCWWRVMISVVLSPVWVISLLTGQLSLHADWGSEDDTLGYICLCKKGLKK